ncbi:pirin family protein [Marinobacterium lutimaris]|uniref:Pirin n=1 Tax=Marinobacterium lutimaris TaxID=568106 RepID=A0A1H5TIW1_9GAMM|nr:pirin family protein [Marinobacterium lutimaris]SEF62720.1 hypothetical protein SAMN05444390_10189 [Marinobacterium lutimaris]
MSNSFKEISASCNTRECDSGIEMVIEPRDRDLGGFSVRRLLPTAKRKMVGPWIFFDHMGPARFAPGEGINVRPHPHINLATVTYLFSGEILHRDSLGSLQPIRPGDINLMVAGRGIVHSERERPEVTASEHELHGLQLWLALPEDDEEREPAFYHYASEQIPKVDVEGVPVRVIMGSAYGLTSPVETYADTLYVEAHLQPGQSLTLPDSQERAVYLAEGEACAAGETLAEHSLAILKPGANITIEAKKDSRIALIGGEPLGKRFIEWNFVSSQKERIEQAKADWSARRFPLIPGDDQEWIRYP